MADNTFVVHLVDGRGIFFSYGVAVAAFLPGSGYVRSEESHSVTSSKHANAFAGKSSVVLSAAAFASAISPVVAR